MRVVAVAAGPTKRPIRLLGDTRPLQTATLYGKVSGYLRQIRVDRGDRVHAGEVLAVINSAETDRAYDSAVSDLQNKQRNMERARDLAAHGGRIVAGRRPDAIRVPDGGRRRLPRRRR